jgi:hypothetical protein
MNNRDFDKRIRDSIEQMDGQSYVPADWKEFESRIDSEVTDEQFDRIIREKLSKGSPGYNPAHWLEYLYRASVVKLLKVDFLYNKLSEALLLGLALLWILPLNNHHPIETESSTIVHSVSSEEGEFDRAVYEYLNRSGKTDPIHQQSHSTEMRLPSGDFDVSSELIAEYSAGLPGAERPALGTSDADFNTSPANTLVGLTDSGVKSPTSGRELTTFLPHINTKQSLSNNGFEGPNPYEVGILANKRPAPIVSPNELNTMENWIPPFTHSQGNRDVNWILSTFLVSDINTIHTPYDEIYQKSGYEQTKLGMGAGITYGATRNGWTLETGFIFSMKQYNPREVLEIFRFGNETAKAVSLKSIELNTLSIPLNLRYDLVSQGRWIPFMKLGIGLNLATHANYQREEYIVALSSRIPDNANVNFSDNAKLDEKRFTDGLLQGGNFDENSYLSANGGLGVDFLVTTEWRLFAQGSYHYNFLETKLGPNNDHINTISLQMGVRHILR